MPEKILQPGIYRDFPESAYFADPCPMPSLTQSIAKIILDRSPLHAWHAHPALNPDYRHDDDTKFDVGNIAHKLMIGRGKDIVVVEFDDWRTKAAKEAREHASSTGKLGVLGKHYARAERMVAAAREQLELRGLGHLFRDGDGEVVLAWRDGDIWCRQLVDWLGANNTGFVDYKTTDMSVAPQNLGRMMVNAGWDVQAAFAERGLDALDPDTIGFRHYLFVVQETEHPHCLSIVEMMPDVMTMGHKKISYAIERWSECMAADLWPGYPTEIVRPEYPGWAESAWLNREIEEAAGKRMPRKDFDPENVMAG